ncbi:hypothetical protein IC007_1101 [Sulfuracidifex tepidarius]|uniref:DNA repair protein n=2 Tax=Sulfuracidifex tepidarius TaxID=1294262 RepID=A0A510E269_9CREN|nr:hypothetical protein IC007_1101 [Sulfuracidifex tepidarius]
MAYTEEAEEMRKIPAELCVKCKGSKYLCGLSYCPIIERFRSFINVVQGINVNDKSVNGSSPPSVVVGERGYPKVKVMYNVPPNVYGDEARKYEDPLGWWGKATLSDIIGYRSGLLSAVKDQRIEDPWSLYEKEISVSSVSQKPVRYDVLLSSTPDAKLKFDGVIMPRGPSAPLQNIKVNDNASLSRTLEKLIFDDLRASEAVVQAYSQGEDIYKLISAMSMGLLGVKKNRKLVPTRWAITSVDSIIGTFLLGKVKESTRTIDSVSVYYSSYLGNYFHIILYPGNYRSSWIEIWYPLSLWSSETTVVELSENFWGKYEYMDGGYMAARLAVMEKLQKEDIQAGIVIIREITSEYYAPVGNWHIRETVRKAMENKISTFDNVSEAFSFVQDRLKDKKVNLFATRSVSDLVKQKKIEDFFK